MVTIPNLTAVTNPILGDQVHLSTGAGSRRCTRQNLQLRHSELTVLARANVNIANDRIWISDATDGALKAISVFDVLFGNFTNLQLTDTFALDPNVHNIRPLQLLGTFTTPNITLSNVTAGIGGSSFNLFNFSTTDITVTAIDSMTIFQNGAAVSPVTIRQDTGATIQVNNVGNEAIFAGG